MGDRAVTALLAILELPRHATRKQSTAHNNSYLQLRCCRVAYYEAWPAGQGSLDAPQRRLDFG